MYKTKKEKILANETASPEAITKAIAILRHLSKTPLDEDWGPINPAEWIIEGINEAIALLEGEEYGRV